ncbi:hypothetical protein Vadar_011917 [Vaccinium darrowii]|uniref:Uncharacterized protein n=1 Tax=Vaccinium darrowii TaxID=229202 RepID=A0ACB7Z5Q1_9ERIC|nr:hypothetical protein Vadar_011917 [Vaccinium darrowii]
MLQTKEPILPFTDSFSQYSGRLVFQCRTIASSPAIRFHFAVEYSGLLVQSVLRSPADWCTHKHDQGCQATKQVQRIQEAPHLYPSNYPSQNPLLEAYFLSFSLEKITTQDAEPRALSFTSETISTQDSEPYPPSFASVTISTQDSEPYNSRSFSSTTISTQYTRSWPCTASSVRKESVQSNSLSGDLPFLSSQHPLPMLLFSEEGLPSRDLPFLPSQRPRPMLPFPQDNGDPWIQLFCQIAYDCGSLSLN